jgi:hypothetical protein
MKVTSVTHHDKILLETPHDTEIDIWERQHVHPLGISVSTRP